MGAPERTLWLARHGHRLDFDDPHWARRAPRPHDPPLSGRGHREAAALARRLAREPIGRVFSSRFLRCVETADPVAAALGLRIALEDGLSEWLNRDWFPEPPALLPAAELARRFPRIDPVHRARGVARYGESGEDALRRAAATARALLREFPGDLLLVGHGASVLGAAAGVLGEPVGPEGGALPRELPTACLVKLVDRDGGWRVELRADTSHLG